MFDAVPLDMAGRGLGEKRGALLAAHFRSPRGAEIAAGAGRRSTAWRPDRCMSGAPGISDLLYSCIHVAQSNCRVVMVGYCPVKIE